ncbi:PepSY-associated TM helix domain-containing protein [uncultured Kriegella sp.]|uniref:PepSY-associated TM helix domain-containing protein n=1 Tax=uncultured Kriegella sp. TaxID=1798910 RepID=UPI0030D7F4CC|tara:strand:+ start:121101 stop:122729 length:1629 start_codon:yes stop_codon:yes gene_type:complete
MANRVYNILFHTHTISGIIISAALYVIFFTGSITFLRDEINAWERNEPIREHYFKAINFDKALEVLAKDRRLYGRDLSFSHRYFEKRVGVSMTRSKDTTIQEPSGRGRRGNFFYMNMDTFEKKDYGSNYSLGEFFYRLHFFAQLNLFGRSGYFLAGLVAFFFLFAVLTGVIVHWKKIISSFYVFRPKAKWKTIWTDAHVALGMIGLPYQFMFAVTGAYLIIGYTVMLPPVQSLMFDDNPKKLQEAAQYEAPDDYPFKGENLEKEVSINQFMHQTTEKWPELQQHQLQIFNYGDKNMHIKVSGSPSFDDKLLGTGYLVFRAKDGTIIREKDPYSRTSYAEGATDLLKRLHFGDFGGYGMKLIYFALGLITCFVILSGVLIWLVARDRKNLPEHKRNFNTWLVRIYMAICLSLYPITAIIFVVVKLFADNYGDGRRDFIYNVFFWGWLLLSALFILKRNNHFTNKFSLLLGAILGIFVPISNGIVTGNWPWVAWQKGYSQIFVVDIFWLLLSTIALLVFFKLRKPKESSRAKKSSKAKLEISTN